LQTDWQHYTPPTPQFTGIKRLEDYSLDEIKKYIDWKPFFIAWEMHGNFPDILQDKIIGKEAAKLFDDANALLNKIIREKWLTAKGVFGFFKAKKIHPDTIAVEDNNKTIHLEFSAPANKKAALQPNLFPSQILFLHPILLLITLVHLQCLFMA